MKWYLLLAQCISVTSSSAYVSFQLIAFVEANLHRSTFYQASFEMVLTACPVHFCHKQFSLCFFSVNRISRSKRSSASFNHKNKYIKNEEKRLSSGDLVVAVLVYALTATVDWTRLLLLLTMWFTQFAVLGTVFMYC